MATLIHFLVQMLEYKIRVVHPIPFLDLIQDSLTKPGGTILSSAKQPAAAIPLDLIIAFLVETQALPTAVVTLILESAEMHCIIISPVQITLPLVTRHCIV